MDTNDAPEVKRVSKPRVSRLRWERERRSWTQNDVAERIGSTQINISRWENGITVPSPYYRQRLGELFGKSIEELDLLPERDALSTEDIQASSHALTSHTSPPPGPIWTVPYRRNPFFTGRKEVLTDLYVTLRGRNTVAVPLAISGLGGIGKTQIAIEYAHRYANDYQAIFWINATAHDTLSADFVMLASWLDLPERREQDQDTVGRAVKRWLMTHTDWLLILDNADNLETIVGFLPPHDTGHVLLTTRLQASGTIAHCIEVEKMEIEEGVMFLLRRGKVIAPDASFDEVMKESRTQAAEIVAILDGLPLALDQAGAYIEETRCGLSQYLNLYATRRKELLLRRGASLIDHPDSVAATWSLSFQQVEQESPAAADLLRLLAFLDSEAIPEEIITLGAAELGPVLRAVASDPLQVDRLIELLLRYSLIRRAPEAKSLSMHRLVQEVLRDGMERDTQKVWAERAIRAMNRAFPYVEPQIWQLQTWQPQILEKCQHCLPHVQRCATMSNEYALAFPEAARLFNEAASYLGIRARYRQAEFLLLRALTIRQQILKAHHPDTARTLNDLGGLYLNAGKYRESEPLLQEALEIRLGVLGEEHPDTAQTLYNLASLYRTRGDYAKAEPLFLQALRIREATLGVASPLVAQSYYGLAKLYYSQGKYLQAEKFCEQSLRIRKQLFGENHLILASTLSVMAKIYQGQNKLDQAEEMNMHALRIRESFSGEDHPHVATIINSLIEIYHAEGRYREAELLIARSLSIQEQSLGSEHPYMAYSFSNRAENFFLQGDYVQAEFYYKKALIIREQRLGLDHPHTASTYYALARLYSAAERYGEAESFFCLALPIRESVFGDDHPMVANTLELYAATLRKQQREHEAVELEERIQVIKARQIAPETS